MAPSRKIANNGRSPIVNKQSQITSFFNTFFNKTTSSSTSPSPSPSTSVTKPNPKLASTAIKPNPNPNFTSSVSTTKTSPSPNPVTPSPQQTKPKKSVLVVGHASSSPVTPGNDVEKKLLGEEVVNRRVRVYWPLDKCWYEGCVKSFDGLSGKHSVLYDDAEEEELDLNKEKIEWIDGGVKSLRRLRRTSVVIDDDEEDEKAVDESGGDSDSMDEDWGKTAVNEVVDEVSEDTELEEENDDDEEEDMESSNPSQVKSSVSRKRKTSPEKLGSAKKSKILGNVKKIGFKVSVGGNGGNIKEKTKNSDGE